LARPRVKDVRFGEPVVGELRHAIPGGAVPLAASSERAPPEVGHVLPKRRERPAIGHLRVLRGSDHAQVGDRASVSRPGADNLEEACKKGHKKGHQRRYRLGLPGDGLRQRSRDNHHRSQRSCPRDTRPIRPTVRSLPAETPEASRWTCSASPRSSTRMRRRRARCSRSPQNSPKTNNPPRPLGSC
jgi:hypothetical protein